MSLLLRIAFVVLVTFGLYNIAHRALYLPDKHALSALRNPHGKPSFDEELSRALRSVMNLISRLFPMSEYKRLRYETDLARLGIATTPQDFVSNAMAKSAMFAIIGIAFIPLGIPWLALLTCVAGILSYFRTTQQLHKRIEALNREVDTELPRMVGMMECTLGNSRDLITFFSRYRKTAGVALGHELDLDESGVNIDLIRRYGRSIGQKRVIDHVPLGTPKRLTILASVRWNGSIAYTTYQGGTTAEQFVRYLKDVLLPTLHAGDIVVMDNMRTHHVKEVADTLQKAGVTLLYLPPYSPDLNPIEMLWSKLKSILRK